MRSMRTPEGRILLVLIRSTSCWTRWIVGMLFSPRRISTMPCTISSSLSLPAIPSRGVADDDRHAPNLSQHGVTDFVERSNKSHASNDGDLRPDVDRAAADVDVAVVQRLQHLRQRDP